MRKNVIALLFFSDWLLLGVSWVMSVYTYARLPQEMALWLSLWKSEVVWTQRSLLFFLFPVAQTIFFFLFWIAARTVFFRTLRLDIMGPGLERDKQVRLLGLKKEVVYLALIFINLIFIHLQTSLILVSHRIGGGINKFYFIMLIGVLLILIPYYYGRGKMLLRDRRGRFSG